MTEIFTAISGFFGLIIKGIVMVFSLILSVVFVSYKGLIGGFVFSLFIVVFVGILLPSKQFDRIKSYCNKNPTPFVIIYIIIALFGIGATTEDYTYNKIKEVFWELNEY